MWERHGASKTRLYKIWCGMRDRCYRTSDDSYQYYGARGISVCEEWRESFSAFQRWALSAGYRSDKSIDRYPDGSGNYEPNNCRWSTDKQQARNKSEAKSHIMIEREGKRLNLSEWAKITKINYTTLTRRYHKGLRGEKLFAMPRMHRDQFVMASLQKHNGNARLTDAQVALVLARDASGVELAKMFKVSPALISMIRTGQRRQ